MNLSKKICLFVTIITIGYVKQNCASFQNILDQLKPVLQNSVTPVAGGAALTASKFGTPEDRATFITRSSAAILVPAILSHKYPDNKLFQAFALTGGVTSFILTYFHVKKALHTYEKIQIIAEKATEQYQQLQQQSHQYTQ